VSEATQIVAIDGPAGAGKSSVAKAVAKALQFSFLDTGAMYRAATWWIGHRGIGYDDQDAVVAAVAAMPLQMHEGPQGVIVLVDGIDVSEAIRSPEVTRNITTIDHIPALRAQLVAMQRAIGERQPVVAEGRDIGTVVFPRARCKIYMDATPEERARRRAEEMRGKGLEVDETALLQDIRKRDADNMNREASPLRQADDAIRLDTTGKTFDEVVEQVLAIARERLAL